jgi:hypothetical protein
MSARAILALLLLPSIALAQRGGGGGGGSSAPSRVRGDPKADYEAIAGNKSGIKLSNRDVEDMSPLKLLLDKRKDLKLSDDQVKGLKDLESKLKESNDASFRALDSLRRAAQPPLHAASDDDRAQMNAARRTFGTVIATIRGNYDASLKDALSLLDETQRSRANEMLEKQRKDAEDVLHDKLGAERS